jgi:methylated-DNA-protein-cysteine methyltransferase related protein
LLLHFSSILIFNLNMFEEIRHTIMRIPKGRVATYGQIAKLAGYPGAARQVVWALRSAAGLPWQRVVGAGGKILLDGHSAMEQRFRLEMEGVRFNGTRVDMKNFAWEPAKKKAAKKFSKRAKK